MYGEQVGYGGMVQDAIERAKQLGRNVANAMICRLEEVKYLGEEAGVVARSAIAIYSSFRRTCIHLLSGMRVRGTIVVDRDKMKVSGI